MGMMVTNKTLPDPDTILTHWQRWAAAARNGSESDIFLGLIEIFLFSRPSYGWSVFVSQVRSVTGITWERGMAA